MKKVVNRRGEFKFRFLELEDTFYDYVEKHQVSPSVLIRHCIKSGLKEGDRLSLDQHNEMKNEIVELRKSLIQLGGNLNQIAHYFNIHEHLNESDLHKNHQELRSVFRDTTEALNKVLNVI